MLKALPLALAAASVAVLAACSSGPAPATPALSLMPDTTTAPALPAVAAVPGTNDNQYDTGPFTVTMKPKVQFLPTDDDAYDTNGNPVPQQCVVVDVKNTSNDFTGWIAPSVEFVKGHSVHGQLLDTEAGDPDGGSSGGESSNLAPGQSQVLYACPVDIPKRVYATFQLTQVSYGTPDQGTIDATTVRLKY